MSRLMIFLITLFVISCGKKEQNDLIGNWKLIEAYWNDGGGNSGWTPRTDDITFTFKQNGTFSSTSNFLSSGNMNCNGTYSFSDDDIISTSYICDTTHFERSYRFQFENGNLLLYPFPNYCDEGCADKYVRR